MSHITIIADRAYEWIIVEGRLQFEGYDREDEEFSVRLTGLYSHLLAFWDCGQKLLNEVGEEEFVKFVEPIERLDKSNKRLNKHEDYFSLASRQKDLFAILYPHDVPLEILIEITNPQILTYLAHTISPRYLADLASNIHTPSRTLEHIYNIGEPNTRQIVCRNPNAPLNYIASNAKGVMDYAGVLMIPALERRYVMEFYKKMKESALQGSVFLEEIMKNTKNLYLLDLMKEEANEKFLFSALRNPNLSKNNLLHICKKLSLSSNPEMRLSGLQVEIRLRLAQDSDPDVRNQAFLLTTRQEKQMLEADADLSL